MTNLQIQSLDKNNPEELPIFLIHSTIVMRHIGVDVTADIIVSIAQRMNG